MYRELIPMVKPGVETLEIDRWVQNWIRKAGGKPAFLGYRQPKNPTPYPASICISINNEVIHGIPSKRKICSGDLVGLDCGIDLDGFISDQALSIEAGKVSQEVHELNVSTRESLYTGIAAIKAGERLLMFARAVEAYLKARGYGIVEDYCGHGVGFALHEDPQVPNYPHGANPRMNNGMVFAVEPMTSLGSGDVELLDDNWTVVTADDSISAHWEHTVAIFQGKTEILTDPLDL